MVKYKQRLAFRPGEEPAEMLRGIWTPTMGEWKEIIEDFVSTAKRRQNNRLAMFRLQMSIFSDIVVLGGSISQYTKLLNHPEEARKWIPEPEPINQAHLDTWKGELNSKKLIISALRDIGDSVAWRVLQYNRPLLYIMTFNQSGGPLRMDIGRGNELYEFADIINDPTITHFFLHDITNFARIGDITSVDDTGIVEFAEVKSKPNPRGNKWKERVERQILRLDNLTKIANEGIGLADDRGIVVKMINSTPKTSMNQIRATVNEAQSSGLASRIIHPYLSITACDFIKKFKEENFKHSVNASRKVIKQKGDILFPINSLSHIEFNPHRAPISIYPFEPSSIAGILLGRIIIFYDFNISRFFRELALSGWSVVDSLIENPQSFNPKTDPFCIIKKGQLNIAVPPSLIARIIFEGLSLKSLLLIFEEIRIAGPAGQKDAMIYGYSGEKQLWN